MMANMHAKQPSVSQKAEGENMNLKYVTESWNSAAVTNTSIWDRRTPAAMPAMNERTEAMSVSSVRTRATCPGRMPSTW